MVYDRNKPIWKIVEGDNFGRDYPNETFVNLSPTTFEKAQSIANVINSIFCDHDQATRFWRVEHQDYGLQPGFTP